MAQHKASDSALVAAARSLDRALEDFAINADQVRRAPLTTERQIARVRQLVAGVAVAEGAIQVRIAALESALAAANIARAAQTAAVAERTPHVEARAAEIQRLLDVYIGLGVRATQHAAGPAPELLVDANALLATARAGDFPDIVQLVQALIKPLTARV